MWNHQQNTVWFLCTIFELELVKAISVETNLYYQQTEKGKWKYARKDTSWNNTTNDEVYIFLAVTMLMSQVKKHKMSKYLSTDEFIQTPIFGKLFSWNWFWQIWKYLHVNDNNNQPKNDQIYKIAPVLVFLLQKFKDIFNSYQALCHDENFMLYKGHLAFKQYIPKE